MCIQYEEIIEKQEEEIMKLEAEINRIKRS